MVKHEELMVFAPDVAETGLIELADMAARAIDSARAFQVTDADSFQDATQLGGQLRTVEKRIDELTKPAIEDAYRTHRSLTQKRAAIIGRISDARTALNNRAMAWRSEQQRREAEEHRRRDAEAAKRAAEEAKRIEDERLAAAIAADERGDTATAEALISAPPPVVEPIAVAVRTEVPKAIGAAIRTTFEFDVVDAAVLPREFLEPCFPAIRERVNRLGELANIPGVRVRVVEKMSNRAG